MINNTLNMNDNNIDKKEENDLINNNTLENKNEIKELIVDLNSLVAKNKNDTWTILNKVEKIEKDIYKIKQYIKWRRIWSAIYWLILIGSFFGIWYTTKDSVWSTVQTIKKEIPKNFVLKDFLEKIKNNNEKEDNKSTIKKEKEKSDISNNKNNE